MERIDSDIKSVRDISQKEFSLYWVLALLTGIVMPVVAAFTYPTYTHIMPQPWVEWTRLQEIPFVACEILIMHWALRRGMNSTAMWNALSTDLKIASIILFAGVFTSSVFISAQPLFSLAISLITVVHLLFAFSVYYLLSISKFKDVDALLSGLGYGLIILAAITAWKFGFPPNLSKIPGGVIEWSSALPGFISVRHFGSWSGAITAGFLAILLFDPDKQNIFLIRFFYFFSASMTIWSGTRAAILAVFLTIIILILSHRKLPSFRAIGIVAMLTGAALITAWLLRPYDDPSFLLYTTADTKDAGQMMGGRLELWTASFEKWQSSPLFGLGSGSVFWEVYVGWSHTQPHNAILQFLISWGLVGASGALWLLGRIIFNAHKRALGHRQMEPLLAILYTLLIMSLLEGMLHYPRFIMLIMILFAVLLSKEPRDSAAHG